MKTGVATYLSMLGVIVILLSQTYVVYQNYIITRSFLTRESNAIIEDAFQKELNQRNALYKHLSGEDTLKAPAPCTTQNNVNFDMRKGNRKQDNVLNMLNLTINGFISQTIPLNLHNLDSITKSILRTRGIHSNYVILVVDPSGKKLEKSNAEFHSIFFLINSNPFPINLEKTKSLQLTLINPFLSVFKRMGILLSGSFLIALFCFYSLWYLFRTQSRQKKLLEVKNDFFGNTAHELKRPVAQLHLALEALSKPAVNENEAKRKRYLEISKEATKDMSEKITMIMTLSMAEEGVFKLNYSHFNLLEELEKLKIQFSTVADKEVNIEIEKTTRDVTLRGDKDHLSQCIANLIDNAIKYSGVSVLICISIRKVKDSLMLSVKDNGIGIKPENLDRVFDKYTRLNTEAGAPTGFGIGLSYVKAVVEKHAGRMEVKSEEGRGSEFAMIIPV